MRVRMGRVARIQIPDLAHHIINRGNNRGDIFGAEQDYLFFLLALRDASARHQVDVHAYALMTNHFHIVATPRTATGLSETMHVVGSKYVGYFNRRHARSGTLFEGRFKSSVIDSDTYWFTCMRYVELNPVRAGLVSDPADYRWSSYRANAFGVHDRLIVPHFLYTSLGESTVYRQQSWRGLCGEAIAEEQLFEIREAARSGGRLSDAVHGSAER